MFICFLTLPSF